MILDKIIREIEKKINEKPTAIGKFVKIKVTELQEKLKKEENKENVKKIVSCLEAMEKSKHSKLKHSKLLTNNRLINQTNYIIMLSTDYEATLQLESHLINDISESMTGIYYENYKKCITVFKNSQFYEVLRAFYIIKENDDIDYLKPFLKNIVDELNTKDVPYMDAYINAYIRDFLTDYKINPALLREKSKDLIITGETDKNKQFIRKIESAILESADINKYIRESLLKKSKVLKNVEKINTNNLIKIRQFQIYLENSTDALSNFHIAAYTMNLMKIQEFVNINNKTMEELLEIVMRLNKYDYEDYETVLNENQVPSKKM